MNKIATSIVVFFLVEIAGFIIVGDLIGVILTLVLIVASTVLGFVVLRDEGVRGAYAQMQMMQGARMIDPEKMPNAFSMIAGVLLILPGFVTDLCGLLLLIKPLQRFIESRLKQRGMYVSSAANEPFQASSRLDDERVIEGEFEEKQD